MQRAFITLVLAAGILGCGNESEVAELRSYVERIQGFDDFNRQVEATIQRFDDPTQEITRADILKARQLIEAYAAAVKAVPPIEYTTLDNTHGVYVRTFNDARRLATDETGDLKRQAHSVAIGLRNIRRDVEGRIYPMLDVLLSRAGLEGQYKLEWPRLNQ